MEGYSLRSTGGPPFSCRGSADRQTDARHDWTTHHHIYCTSHSSCIFPSPDYTSWPGLSHWSNSTRTSWGEDPKAPWMTPPRAEELGRKHHNWDDLLYIPTGLVSHGRWGAFGHGNYTDIFPAQGVSPTTKPTDTTIDWDCETTDYRKLAFW